MNEKFCIAFRNKINDSLAFVDSITVSHKIIYKFSFVEYSCVRKELLIVTLHEI